MSMESINIKVDSEVKRQAQELFESLGMSFGTAVNVFIRQAIRENAIPFRVAADPFYSVGNQKYLAEVIRDIESGKSVLKEHTLAEVDE